MFFPSLYAMFGADAFSTVHYGFFDNSPMAEGVGAAVIRRRRRVAVLMYRTERIGANAGYRGLSSGLAS